MNTIIERPLKEIDYMSDKFEILGSGIINQIPWLIIYTGNHPCAYVCVHEKLAWEVKLLADYNLSIDINFEEDNGSPINTDIFNIHEFDIDKSEKCVWLGWDYAHLFDMNHNAIRRWSTGIDDLTVHYSEEIFNVIQKIANKISQVRKDEMVSEITTNCRLSDNKSILWRTGIYRDIDYVISYDDMNFLIRIEYLDLSPAQLDAVTDQFDISINKYANMKVFGMTRSIGIPFNDVMKDIYKFIDIIRLLEKDE